MPETESDIPPENHEPRQTRTRPGRTIEVWLGIARQTLREPILRFAGHLALLAIIALGVWAARVGLDTLPADAARTVETSTELLQATVTVASIQELEDLPPFSGGPLVIEGVTRIADVHTIFPTRPRLEVIKYVVQKGDHLFGISEKFGIKPGSDYPLGLNTVNKGYAQDKDIAIIMLAGKLGCLHIIAERSTNTG